MGLWLCFVEGAAERGLGESHLKCQFRVPVLGTLEPKEAPEESHSPTGPQGRQQP